MVIKDDLENTCSCNGVCLGGAVLVYMLLRHTYHLKFSYSGYVYLQQPCATALVPGRNVALLALALHHVLHQVGRHSPVSGHPCHLGGSLRLLVR